jgi:Zn-dependent peptidase ImmA (M78 family)
MGSGAKENQLRWGFKAFAERTSLALRKELAIKEWEPLPAAVLAHHLEVPIFTPSGLGYGKSYELQADGIWSALAHKMPNKKWIVIHNEMHAKSRQESDLMHELGHVILDHGIPEEYKSMKLPFGMLYFNKAQELEAECLGATLQMTRNGLLKLVKDGMNKEQLADHFLASSAMVNFRTHQTGVFRQIQRTRKIFS